MTTTPLHGAISPTRLNRAALRLATLFLCLLLPIAVLAEVDPTAPAGSPKEAGTVAYRSGDFARSYEIWSKAAQQGDHRAQFLLSTLYEEGRGVDMDASQAQRWLNSAAAGGFAPAQYNLGNHYYNGQGVEQDESRAVEWWTRAARQGFTEAQYNLGVAYVTGRGIERNDAEGIRWFSQAALAGSAQAREILQRNGIDIYGTREGADAPPSTGEQAAKAAEIPAEQTLASTPATKPDGVTNADWIRQLPPSAHTIQLLSTPDAARASAFAQRILSETGAKAPVALFDFDRKGTRYHAVILGKFADRASAVTASQQLPLDKWQTSAWVRDFASIQKLQKP